MIDFGDCYHSNRTLITAAKVRVRVSFQPTKSKGPLFIQSLSDFAT
jgi:hypothetical protein